LQKVGGRRESGHTKKGDRELGALTHKAQQKVGKERGGSKTDEKKRRGIRKTKLKQKKKKRAQNEKGFVPARQKSKKRSPSLNILTLIRRSEIAACHKVGDGWDINTALWGDRTRVPVTGCVTGQGPHFLFGGTVR